MVFKKKLCTSAKEDISRLPKEVVVPVRAGLRGNERNFQLRWRSKTEKKKGGAGAAFLRKI